MTNSHSILVVDDDYIRMPGIEGLEVCRRLKVSEETGNIPVMSAIF